MPKGVTEPFTRIGDVWVVSPQVMRPVAETLRVTLLELQRLRLVNTGRNEKQEQLYNYLSSAPFAQRVRTMLESFEAMRSDLEAEKRALQKIWAKRLGPDRARDLQHGQCRGRVAGHRAGSVT